MIVTLSAGQCQPQPRCAGGVNAIEENHIALLLGNGAPLSVQEVVAIESTGNPLLDCGVWQEITGELLCRKLIERHIGIERGYHPIPPDPLRGVAILLEAVRIGVPRRIEP